MTQFSAVGCKKKQGLVLQKSVIPCGVTISFLMQFLSLCEEGNGDEKLTFACHTRRKREAQNVGENTLKQGCYRCKVDVFKELLCLVVVCVQPLNEYTEFS